jgi:hypothetical protein
MDWRWFSNGNTSSCSISVNNIDISDIDTELSTALLWNRRTVRAMMNSSTAMDHSIARMKSSICLAPLRLEIYTDEATGDVDITVLENPMEIVAYYTGLDLFVGEFKGKYDL